MRLGIITPYDLAAPGGVNAYAFTTAAWRRMANTSYRPLFSMRHANWASAGVMGKQVSPNNS